MPLSLSRYHQYKIGEENIRWFWEILHSFNRQQRASFLQFVTGTYTLYPIPYTFLYLIPPYIYILLYTLYLPISPYILPYTLYLPISPYIHYLPIPYTSLYPPIYFPIPYTSLYPPIYITSLYLIPPYIPLYTLPPYTFLYTGTSKVPLGGFSNLQGMRGTQRFSIHRAYGEPGLLPSAHTCFNQVYLIPPIPLKLPIV